MTHRITNSTHHADNGAIGLIVVAVVGSFVFVALCFGIGAIVARVI